MSGSIEDVARSWLLDPAWQKVFKHTFDIIKDYVSYVLIAVGAISLSVRLLTTLSTGDLVCIIVGVKGADEGTLGPYPSGGSLGLLNYAQTEPVCIRAVFSHFMEYLPYIILVQSLLLIIVDKITFKIPKVAHKVERFYKNIVEDSLFGKDSDVAEDMTDPKTSTGAISRERQRNEICISLKRSSSIYKAYIMRNVIEIFIALCFVIVNLGAEIMAELKEETSEQCVIHISAFPGMVEEEGQVVFQCRGKKYNFFLLTLYFQTVLVALYGFMSVGALVWCFKFRAVTRLLHKIEKMESLVSHDEGKDFLFLFDLLAHNCGLEATLRVLTHSDDNFCKICRPVSIELQLEEDKLEICWGSADIERWMEEYRKSAGAGDTIGSISFDSYEVTIFPAESANNIKKGDKNMISKGYHKWFYDLIGGRTEYVITIACVIGRSRMKGQKIVTTLVPYGPEMPKSGILEKAGTNQVDIFWDPPKGDFAKYIISIDKANSSAIEKSELVRRQSELKIVQLTTRAYDTGIVLPDSSEFDQSNVRHIENLSNKLTRYTILGLEPGEAYMIELGTKTGNVYTRQPINEIVMTRPLPVNGIMTSEITSESCIVHWTAPEGHSFLKGFQIEVRGVDGKLFRTVTVSKVRKSFPFGSMLPATDYDISIISKSVCHERREASDRATISVTTLPERISNIRLDHATPNSILLKWDPPSSLTVHLQQSSKYRMTVKGVNFYYVHSVDIPGDKTQYNISKLPDPEGSGQQYTVGLVYSVVTQKDAEVHGTLTEALFATIPYKPASLRITNAGTREICWQKSATPHVSAYRVRWKSVEEAAKAEEDTVSVDEDNIKDDLKFSLPRRLKSGIMHKVNINAVVHVGGGNDAVVIESKELHEKFIIATQGGERLEVYDEQQHQDIVSVL
jgi:hypothetical protein